MAHQPLHSIEFSAQHFFARHKLVDGGVAIPAGRHSFAHLLSRVPFQKPLVAMASPRNEMMLGRAPAKNSAAKDTLPRLEIVPRHEVVRAEALSFR